MNTGTLQLFPAQLQKALAKPSGCCLHLIFFFIIASPAFCIPTGRDWESDPATSSFTVAATGGLEAAVTPSGITGTIADVFGNFVTSIGGNNTVTWSATKVGGYGPLPQYAAQTLESGASRIEASAWKARRADPTGLMNLGARHYDYGRGGFVSADPLGHASSWSLYDYANGDPINQFDADGRYATQYGNWMQQGGMLGNDLRNATSLLESAANWGVNNNNAALAAAASFGSSITGSLAGMAAPSSYVTSAINYSANIGTVYEERGVVDASSYALTSWNVGAIGSGALNVNLVTGGEVGDFFDRATMVSGGVAGTAGVAAGVMAVWSKGSVATSSGAAGRPPTTVLSDVTVVSHGKVVMRGNVYIGDTLRGIESGSIKPRDIFQNRPVPGRTVPELPVEPAGYYQEFVHPTPGVSGAGSQRIVRGANGELYYTADHYGSFIKLN